LPRIRDVAESNPDPEVGKHRVFFLMVPSLPLGKCQHITGTLTLVTRITFHVLCSCSLMLSAEKAVKCSMNKYIKKDKESG
jgi:hypothetical protein